MNFKSFLLIAAFVGLFALTAATSKTNDMLSGLEKLRAGFPQNLRTPLDASELIDPILLYWNLGVSRVYLDNIKFSDSAVSIPTGRLEFHNTHFRGLHRLEQLQGQSTIEPIGDYESILSFTLRSDALQFHSEMVYYDNDGSSTGMRSMASLRNFNVHAQIYFNFTSGIEIPFRITELYIAGIPRFSVKAKTLNSQWGDAPTGNAGIVMANVEEYLKTTHIPKLLRDLFSQKNIAAVNSAIQETFPKRNRNSEVGPSGLFDDYAFIWFFRYKSVMCPTYKLYLNHTLENDQPGTGRMTVKNGEIRGLDYIKRTECGDKGCNHVPCPTGSFIFDYDDIYVDYDIVADINGKSSQGKMTVTISGLQEKDDHKCVTQCTGLWCNTSLVRQNASFLKLGKVLVDVEGLPDELRPRHRDLIAFAENTRGKLVEQISSGVYGDGHLDNVACMIY